MQEVSFPSLGGEVRTRIRAESLLGSRRRELRSRLCRQDQACQENDFKGTHDSKLDRCRRAFGPSTAWCTESVIFPPGLENRAFAELLQSPWSFLVKSF